MQKTKRHLIRVGQGFPIGKRRFEQREGAHNIGLYKLSGLVNGPVYVTFSGEMQDRAGLMLAEQRVHCSAVANVRPRENMIRVAEYRFERPQIPGVGQLVYVQ